MANQAVQLVIREGARHHLDLFVLYRCVSDDGHLGELHEGTDLGGLVLTQSCVVAGEI